MADDTPNIRELPTPERDEVIAAFAGMARMWVIMVEHSAEIAAMRRKMYLAYVDDGFTEAQALELSKSSQL